MKKSHSILRYVASAVCFLCFGQVLGQSLAAKLQSLQQELANVRTQEQQILKEIESVKLTQVQEELLEVGLPKMEADEQLIKHSAMMLVYDEEHEQAKWVAHMITQDIKEGRVTRTNDFRPDPMVKTGTAIEKDYFLKFLQPDSTYQYDGYGYDRGHLAPSADFRWSEQALSESYFYSNMSPQLPEFNREIWADLENTLRGYIYRHANARLLVVTGGILSDDLPKVERSENQVSVPKFFYKVVLDLTNKRAIAFVLPNQGTTYPLASFAVSIDQVEQVTGLDFYHQLEDDLEDQLEAMTETEAWIPEVNKGYKKPIAPDALPKNAINTAMAKQWVDNAKDIKVCGTVVSARASRRGNILINLDQPFPDQVFTIFIRKEYLVNFAYDPEKELNGQQICGKGRVVDFNGQPAMFIEDEAAIEWLGSN